MAVTPEELATIYELDEVPELVPRYNIAPSQPVGVVRASQERQGRRFALTRWGLVPFWAKDPKVGNRMINARAETVAAKPAFRAAFRYRRCLVPASGFFEWQPLEGGGKQPWYFRMAGGEPASLAGIWETWHAPDGTELETCAILTTGANTLVAPVHQRMPVLIAHDDVGRWLDPGDTRGDDLHRLLRPFDPARMEAWRVATLVNSPRNDGPGIIDPLPDGPPPFRLTAG
jgi:putative SOS response-associated peptidase YedK